MRNHGAAHTDRSPLARTAAIAAGALFSAIGVLHALWAVGSTWPFRDKEALSEMVWGGPASTFPSPAATMVVSALLWTAALLVTGRAGMWGARMPRWVFSVGTWAVASVLFLRVLYLGLGSIGSDAVNAGWELALFSPLCLVLALLCVVVARHGPRPRRSLVTAAT
ncbi:MAG: DUF3995 domain-containing protein [Actinomycetota bacterium]|nr:DUF3995 domain-containing protein [Actinomycetota bacterium]